MKSFRLVLGLLCMTVGIASAQTVGEITGEVKDQSGANAPNVSVTATNTATNVTRSTVTNGSGVYSFPDLAPGMYHVKVARSGAFIDFDVQVRDGEFINKRVDF